MHFGTPTPHQRECFTRVLKGHIALDRVVFPQGITGYKIDVLARAALWEVGLDYNHGTGHGVGHFLNVHEGPQGIGARKPWDEHEIKAGMTITNEPGYYESGAFGIRIENVLLVKTVQTPFNFNNKQYLGFEHITVVCIPHFSKQFTQFVQIKVPIQTSLIEKSLLISAEIKWINDYNKKCFDTLSPLLKDDNLSMTFLQEITTPI